MKRLPFALTLVVASVVITTAQTGKRPLSLDDLGKLKEVRDPQRSPQAAKRVSWRSPPPSVNYLAADVLGIVAGDFSVIF